VDEAAKYEVMTDPELEAAVTAMPKAQALLASTRKLVVERMKK
jgi:hypothetical protein